MATRKLSVPVICTRSNPSYIREVELHAMLHVFPEARGNLFC